MTGYNVGGSSGPRALQEGIIICGERSIVSEATAVATVMGIYQFVKLMMNNATITFRENYTVRSPWWMKDQEISSSVDKWRLARCLEP